jgi:hypothetical protein
MLLLASSFPPRRCSERPRRGRGDDRLRRLFYGATVQRDGCWVKKMIEEFFEKPPKKVDSSPVKFWGPENA